jgi:hypothetical protein
VKPLALGRNLGMLKLHNGIRAVLWSEVNDLNHSNIHTSPPLCHIYKHPHLTPSLPYIQTATPHPRPGVSPMAQLIMHVLAFFYSTNNSGSHNVVKKLLRVTINTRRFFLIVMLLETT